MGSSYAIALLAAPTDNATPKTEGTHKMPSISRDDSPEASG
ncbi:hypothetical protein POV26_09575 [Aequorivita todarodis]|nr:hypothetical protein [Aequorivita todarodis]MDC8001287.1 hypothetical protein [Aequorivita todarodis]